ncbi:MAG: hypothetical protein WBL02_06620 [Methanomethylovorans sp.]
MTAILTPAYKPGLNPVLYGAPGGLAILNYALMLKMASRAFYGPFPALIRYMLLYLRAYGTF